jgi:hypothetical protein
VAIRVASSIDSVYRETVGKDRADQGSVLLLRRISKSVVLKLWHTLQGVLGRPTEDSVVGIPLILGGS